jgi:hypothetical protein
MNTHTQRRRGISLLEVLISIGILSIGLASVLALLPAGGSQARKAMIEDRRGALGAGAIADCHARGFLNPSSWIGASVPPVMIDPLGVAYSVSSVPTGMSLVSISGIPNAAVADYVCRGGDDLAVQIPDNEDLPPVPLMQGNARRLTEGNFSWLATITPVTTVTAPFFCLSVVEFYRRSFDPASGETSIRLSGTFSGPSASLVPVPTLSLDKDDFKTFFPTGGVVLVTTGTTSFQWRRILMAAPEYADDGSTLTSIDLSFNQDVTPTTITGTIFAYGGAVGVAEQIIRLDEATP